MILGLISDTHGLLRDSVLRAIRNTSLIIHAGDVGDPKILEALANLAPVTAVRGNVDTAAWATKLLPTAVVQGAAVSGSGRFQGAFAHHLHQRSEDADDVYPGRNRFTHTSGRRWRADVSRSEVSQNSDGDGEISKRDARAVALGSAVAPGGKAAAHSRLVRSLVDGSGKAGIRSGAGRRRAGETKHRAGKNEAAGELRTKHQAPTSKHQRNSKHRSSNAGAAN